MLKVRKRDESIVEFDLTRIEKAIERAFVAEHKEADKNIIELLALRVTAEFNKKVNNGIVDVEDIQDSVEIVLIQAGYVDVAHSYMDYRKKHADIREIKKTELNYATVVDNYLKARSRFSLSLYVG